MFNANNAGFGSFADMFEQQRRQAQMRGADMQAGLRITLREAAEGARRTLHVPTRNIKGKRETREVYVDIPAGGAHLTLQEHTWMW